MKITNDPAGESRGDSLRRIVRMREEVAMWRRRLSEAEAEIKDAKAYEAMCRANLRTAIKTHWLMSGLFMRSPWVQRSGIAICLAAVAVVVWSNSPVAAYLLGEPWPG